MTLRGRGRGASNASRRLTSPSIRSPPADERENNVPQIQPEQFNLLVQQVQTLATAIQNLQQAGVHLQPPQQPPAEPEPPTIAHESRRGNSQSPGANSEGHHRHRSPSGESPRRHISGTRQSKKPRPTLRPPLSEAGSTPSRSPPAQRAATTAREDNLDRKVEELERRLDAIREQGARPGDNYEFSIKSPFVSWIEEQPIPQKFKMPQMEPYAGSADPLEHLESYRVLMALQGASESLLCKAFPATLRGIARLWFCGLGPSSISSFEQLGKIFLSHFATSRRQRRTSDSLLTIKQKEGESLKDYLDRFTAATWEIRDLDHSIAMSALKTGVQYYKFLFSIEKRFPVDYAEMLARAWKYAKAEEAMTLRRDAAGRPPKVPKKQQREERGRPRSRSPRRGKVPSQRKSPPRRRSPPRLRSPPRPRSPARKYQNYTPLVAPRAEILMEIEGEDYPPRPPRMKPSETRGQSKKYCRFHRDYGHDTEDCYQLKNEIEALIRRGRLSRYVQGRDKGKKPVEEPPPADQPDGGRPIAGIINTIGKGPARRPRTEDEETTPKRLHTAETISFSNNDLAEVETPHDDAVVVSLLINNFDVKRVLVDNGSSADILFYDAFLRMGLTEDQLQKMSAPLIGFSGDAVPTEGTISLLVTAGRPPRESTVLLNFLVVRTTSAYNAILGRPGLNALRAVVSTYHLLVKFPTKAGVGEVRGDQMLARQCYSASYEKERLIEAPVPAQPIETLEVVGVAQKQRAEPGGLLLQVPLRRDCPDRVVQIGADLDPPIQAELIHFLRNNADLFAWSPADMPGIDPEVMVHRLNVNPAVKPIRQKKRSFAPERQRAAAEEVDKLLKADFIKEVTYPDWLANVVLVKKHNGKWRMCVDYTDLNKACPKDSYPLPRIDQLVDATSGHQLLTFMDAFSGYNQIRMAPEDEEKTAFITDKGLYCYKVMPFGLKNAGASYQRLVNKIFKDQIGRNMEVYVDDMLVKSQTTKEHITDLAEAFSILRRYDMKLNPTKCAFGVGSGKFLGFVVTQRGIEANPEKIQALQEMTPPKTVKEVQRLAGRVAALGRFVARSAERCLPFFKALKKPKDFVWTEECQRAFEELRSYLSSPPLLTKPRSGELLYLYLAVSKAATSSVLVREGEDKSQKPVYYTSRILKDAETRYSKLEKTVYALIISARRLRPYFQAHSIVVLTDQPIKQVLLRSDRAGRIAKWAVELGEFDLEYRPRPAIKAQVLADFLVECTLPDDPEFELSQNLDADKAQWVLYVDGSSTSGGSGAGLVLIGPDEVEVEQALRFEFAASNNEAEYEALIAGLKLAKELEVDHLKALSDSQLVVGQILGEFEAREPTMQRYLQKVRGLISTISTFEIQHIPRSENAKADLLSKLASSRSSELPKVTYLEYLKAPTIDEPDPVLCTEVEPSWMDPLNDLLQHNALPEDKVAARRLKRQATRYLLHEGKLYRRSFTSPLLRCLRPSEADYALREVHEGICGSHVGGRALAHKIMRQGYYWPTLQKDAAEFVQRCDRCQRNASIQRRPALPLTSIVAPWPFAQWGIDILGPFPLASGQRKFLVVAIDYFTKWVEAEPLARITEAKMRDFVWKSIICRFGLPRIIITDNGRQFDNVKFREFCSELGIDHRLTSVAHPQANGEAEVTNRTILQGLKARLDRAKGQWVEDLYNVLWAYRTTFRIPTGETPFNLAYGTEAVIPLEVGLLSPRVEYFDEVTNSEKLRSNLDLLEETREAAQVRMARHQQQAARYYNSRVKIKTFRVGDLVLRRTEASRPADQGKLAPNWEGPYRVSRVQRPGAYKLESLDQTPIPRSWNSTNLRMYHQ